MDENRSRHFKYLLQQKKEEHQGVLEDMLEGVAEGYRPLEDSELSRYDNHPADGATELFDAEHLANLRNHHEFAVREIEDALKKIENNRYGVCELCGRLIAEKRLEIVPHARNCISCETSQEKENRLDEISKSAHRPVEEDVIEKELRGDYLHELNGDEPYDGEQALEEVLSFGSSDSPQDGAPLGNRQDGAENGRSIHQVRDIDEISNEMYKNQLA